MKTYIQVKRDEGDIFKKHDSLQSYEVCEVCHHLSKQKFMNEENTNQSVVENYWAVNSEL